MSENTKLRQPLTPLGVSRDEFRGHWGITVPLRLKSAEWVTAIVCQSQVSQHNTPGPPILGRLMKLTNSGRCKLTHLINYLYEAE